jgi:ABC-type amino acid transport substrate-binding protein
MLKSGELTAAVMDEGVLQSIVNNDKSCSMRLIPEKIVITDSVMSFRRTFKDDAFRRAVDSVLLAFLEDGTLSVCPSLIDTCKVDQGNSFRL